MEIGADVAYRTPKRVQIWFLKRSRKLWKHKHKELKVDQKRLQNRVSDVTKSREMWQTVAENARQRVRELEAENALLRKQLEAEKKSADRYAE
jgi:hypothetical protein